MSPPTDIRLQLWPHILKCVKNDHYQYKFCDYRTKDLEPNNLPDVGIEEPDVIYQMLALKNHREDSIAHMTSVQNYLKENLI